MLLNNMFLFVPGRAGTAEGVRAGVFVLLGMPASTGVAYGLVRRARELLWVLPGLAFLWRRPAARATSDVVAERFEARRVRAGAMTASTGALATGPRPPLRLRRHARRGGRALEGPILPALPRGGARRAAGRVRSRLLRSDGLARRHDPRDAPAFARPSSGSPTGWPPGSNASNALLRRIGDRFTEESLRQLAQSAALLSRLRERYRIGIVSNFYGNLQAVCDEVGLSSLDHGGRGLDPRGLQEARPAGSFRRRSTPSARRRRRRSSWATPSGGTWPGRGRWECGTSGCARRTPPPTAAPAARRTP